MEKQITFRLLLILAVYASLTFSSRKRWLQPIEVGWIGGMVIFWAIGFLLSTIIPIVRAKYPERWEALGISSAMILPIILAMIFSLVYMIRRMKKEDAAKLSGGDITSDTPVKRPKLKG